MWLSLGLYVSLCYIVSICLKWVESSISDLEIATEVSFKAEGVGDFSDVWCRIELQTKVWCELLCFPGSLLLLTEFFFH